MPAPVPASGEDKLARLAALKETLARKGLLVELPEEGAPAGPPPLPTGWPEVDALLGGGFPRRAITEVLGAPASGKTSLTAAMLAPLTQGGAFAAWIDSAARLSPPARAAAGVDLSRVLFVRPHQGERGAGGLPRGGRSEPEGRASPDQYGKRLDAEDAGAALWAAEVLLQSGSFEVVVLDACGLPAPPRRALDRRAPILRGAAEAYDSALVVLAEEP